MAELTALLKVQRRSAKCCAAYSYLWIAKITRTNQKKTVHFNHVHAWHELIVKDSREALFGSFWLENRARCSGLFRVCTFCLVSLPPHTVWGRLPGSVFILRGAESDIWICWSPFVFRLYD